MNDRFNFQKLDDGSWGVKVQGYPGPSTRTGDIVQVPRRDGSSTQVRLGRKVTSWNGGRAVVYEVHR